jgi:hypothetical protein
MLNLLHITKTTYQRSCVRVQNEFEQNVQNASLCLIALKWDLIDVCGICPA